MFRFKAGRDSRALGAFLRLDTSEPYLNLYLWRRVVSIYKVSRYESDSRSFSHVPLRYRGTMRRLIGRGKDRTFYPLPQSKFHAGVSSHLRPWTSFVDVGCGPGDKLHLAKSIQPRSQITGIEFDSELAGVAKKACPWANVIQSDAVDVDYGEFDVIYTFRPIQDERQFFNLERRIARTMKPGAVFISAHATQLTRVPRYESWRKTGPYEDFSVFVKPFDATMHPESALYQSSH